MTTKAAVIEAQRALREAEGDLRRAQEAYDRARDVFDLPQIFHSVAQALPVACDALHAVHAYLKDGFNEVQSIEDVAVHLDGDAVTKTQTSANYIAEVFEAVTDAGDGIRMAKYEEEASKDRHVEVLMANILKAIMVFAKPPLITKAQHTALKDSLGTITDIQPVPTHGKEGGITYHGSGTQSIHQGEGAQNINAGRGHQFNGTFGRFPFQTFDIMDADTSKLKNVRDEFTAILFYLRCLADFKLVRSP